MSSCSTGTSSSKKESLARLKALELSSKVKSLRSVVAPYQLGGTGSDKPDNDDDIDDDVSCSSSSEEEGVVAAGEADENRSGNKCPSPRSPASVVDGSKTAFAQGVTSSSGSSKSNNNNNNNNTHSSKSPSKQTSKTKSKSVKSVDRSHKSQASSSSASANASTGVRVPAKSASRKNLQSAVPTAEELGYGEVDCVETRSPSSSSSPGAAGPKRHGHGHGHGLKGVQSPGKETARHKRQQATSGAHSATNSEDEKSLRRTGTLPTPKSSAAPRRLHSRRSSTGGGAGLSGILAFVGNAQQDLACDEEGVAYPPHPVSPDVAAPRRLHSRRSSTGGGAGLSGILAIVAKSQRDLGCEEEGVAQPHPVSPEGKNTGAGTAGILAIAQNQKALGHGEVAQLHRVSPGSIRTIRTKEGGEKTSDGEQKTSLLSHLSSGRKIRRRGSTGSIMKDDLTEKIMRPGEMQPSKKGVESGDDVEVVDMSEYDATHNTDSTKEKRRKPRRFKRSLSTGSKVSSGSKRSAKSAGSGGDASSNHGSSKDAAHITRSKFVTQKRMELPKIDRRSRRHLVKDVGPDQALVQQNSISGSISSITVSTGIGSRDDFSLPSPYALKSSAGPAALPPRSSSARWQTKSKKSQNASSDDIPQRPTHDLSSMCSPGNTLHSSHKSNLNANPVARFVSPMPGSVHGSEITTPSTLTHHSHAAGSSLLSGNWLSPPLGGNSQHLHDSKNQRYPEIHMPNTPTRSTGEVSGLTTPGSSHGSSLHSRLQKLPPSMHATGMALRTPLVSKNKLSDTLQQIPETPGVSIHCGNYEMTPGGIVSEITHDASFAGTDYLDASERQGSLARWMTGVKSTMLAESEYTKDGIPRMVRRHSLDSVSYAGGAGNDCEGNEQPLLGTALSNLDAADLAPRAPSRRISEASKDFRGYRGRGSAANDDMDLKQSNHGSL